MTENETKYEGVVYLITNKVNGKKYVGQAVDFPHRKSCHYYSAFTKKNKDHNCILYNSMRKYGWENFEWEILCTVTANNKYTLKEGMDFMECYNIQELNTINPNGYNMKDGGDGSVGFKHTEESKKKMSDKLSGENHPFYGKKFSEEHRKNIGDGRRGKKHSDKTKQHLSDYWRGKRTSGDNPIAKAVIQMDMDGNFIKKWDSLADATREYGTRHISCCCNGLRKSTAGYKWKHAEE